MIKRRKYVIYLAGPIKIWKEQFQQKYSKIFGHKIDLIEPGDLSLLLVEISKNHRKISQKIARMCLAAIEHSDAVLAYIKPYEPEEHMSLPGVDSCWELGYACGIGKPVIALIDSLEDLNFWESAWMVSLSITAVLTCDKEVALKVKEMERFYGVDNVYCEEPGKFEEKLIEYLDFIIKEKLKMK